MYAYIRGTVDEKNLDRVVMEAAGVGYELICSDATLRQLSVGDKAKLLTHFNVSQDGTVTLYGFMTSDERAMFRRLIAVNRVGPKLALGILSKLTPSDIAMAIVTQNAAAFDRIPGLGKKTAARLLLELKEKVTEYTKGTASAPQMVEDGVDMRAEAIAALVALGYDGVSAGRAVSAVGECARVEDMITKALREIGKRSGF